jgi:NAD(P)-dependent dehydrogenase (short-subunit alcohol dehydrogenase family)
VEKVFPSPEAAIRGIQDGATLAIAGFSVRRRFATSLILALRERGAKDLTMANEIESAGGSSLSVKADVTIAADVEAMVKAVMDKWGKIDILVNGVGGFKRVAPITDLTEEDWDETITLNLKSVFLCVRAVAKIMKQQKSGVVRSVGTDGHTDRSGAYASFRTACDTPAAGCEGAVDCRRRRSGRQHAGRVWDFPARRDRQVGKGREARRNHG